MKTNRLNLDPGMEKAINAVLLCVPAEPAYPPERDWRLISLKQILELNVTNLKYIDETAATVQQSRLSAKAAIAELRCRIELLEDQLGVEKPETEND